MEMETVLGKPPRRRLSFMKATSASSGSEVPAGSPAPASGEGMSC